MKHLDRYISEFQFKFNNRREENIFAAVVIGLVIKSALRYSEPSREVCRVDFLGAAVRTPFRRRGRLLGISALGNGGEAMSFSRIASNCCFSTFTSPVLTNRPPKVISKHDPWFYFRMLALQKQAWYSYFMSKQIEETSVIVSPQALGGIERAKSLSEQERQDIAKRAAKARWGKLSDPGYVPQASHQGQLPIGEEKLDCYVLEDRRRLFHKRGMAKAIGLKSSGGNAFMKTLSRKGLGSGITPELWAKINNPIVFKPLNGDPAHGYEAAVLIDVCDAIIQARNQQKLLPSQMKMALRAELIFRSAAKLGIIALIDEATGYASQISAKKNIEELFKEFIREECRDWSRYFRGHSLTCCTGCMIFDAKTQAPLSILAFSGTSFVGTYTFRSLAARA